MRKKSHFLPESTPKVPLSPEKHPPKSRPGYGSVSRPSKVSNNSVNHTLAAPTCPLSAGVVVVDVVVFLSLTGITLITLMFKDCPLTERAYVCRDELNAFLLK